MLDIIIPSYNDQPGLINTLCSIGGHYSKDQIQITIVDDCSTNVDYELITRCFSPIMSLQIFTLEKNSGPGIARQYGLDHTHKPWVMFLDCGNLLKNNVVLDGILKLLSKNEYMIYMSPLTEYTENHEWAIQRQEYSLHGTIFKRELLDKYPLTMPTAFPYYNEDSTWCSCYRLIADSLNKLGHLQDPFIISTFNNHSLTNENQGSNFRRMNITSFCGNLTDLLPRMAKYMNEFPVQAISYSAIALSYLLYLDLTDEETEIKQMSKQAIKDFYLNIVIPFKEEDPSDLFNYMCYHTFALYLDTSPDFYYNHNFNAFLQELEDEDS